MPGPAAGKDNCGPTTVRDGAHGATGGESHLPTDGHTSEASEQRKGSKVQRAEAFVRVGS